VRASGDNHLVHLVLLNKSRDRSVGFSEQFGGFAAAYSQATVHEKTTRVTNLLSRHESETPTLAVSSRLFGGEPPPAFWRESEAAERLRISRTRGSSSTNSAN